MRRRCGFLGLAVGLGMLAASAADPVMTPKETPKEEEKPLRMLVHAEVAPGFYSAQLLGELDRPIGQSLTLAGLTIPARVDKEKGQLELDLRNDGKFSTYRQEQSLSLNLPREGAKTPLAVKIHLKKQPDGAWTYRNVTQLSVRIENEQFVIVDANGNGVYNEPGVDGIGLQSATYLFPLPSPGERWCTTEQEYTGLSLGPWGEDPKVSGRALATQHAGALPVLKGVIEERLKLGLTPRPEDPKLSSDLQKHCHYMAQSGALGHGEEKGKPGYTPEGAAAGPRSILSQGQPPGHIAAGMVQTYFHRIDVIRPDALAFGVGYEARFGGIDGRTNLRKDHAKLWPVLCPAPGQTDIGLTYGREAPDATPGDDRAGFPVTVQFHTQKLKLTSYTLRAVAAGATGPAKDAPNIECYTYDPKTGAASDMTGYLECVCVIPKDPLQSATEYEVTLNVEVDGQAWARTWRFTTVGGKRPRR